MFLKKSIPFWQKEVSSQSHQYAHAIHSSVVTGWSSHMSTFLLTHSSFSLTDINVAEFKFLALSPTFLGIKQIDTASQCSKLV